MEKGKCNEAFLKNGKRERERCEEGISDKGQVLLIHNIYLPMGELPPSYR